VLHYKRTKPDDVIRPRLPEPFGVLLHLRLLEGAHEGRILVVVLQQERLQLHRWRCVIILILVGGRGKVAILLARLEVMDLRCYAARLVLPHEESTTKMLAVVGLDAWW
jgi:hypothetical protein